MWWPSTTPPSAMAAGPIFRGTEIEPGVDCPHGSTTHFAIPAQVAKTFSLIPWRTPKEVEALANPPADGLERNPPGVSFHTWRAASAYRAYNAASRPM